MTITMSFTVAYFVNSKLVFVFIHVRRKQIELQYYMYSIWSKSADYD
jgi:hypothetical protein